MFLHLAKELRLLPNPNKKLLRKDRKGIPEVDLHMIKIHIRMDIKSQGNKVYLSATNSVSL